MKASSARFLLALLIGGCSTAPSGGDATPESAADVPTTCFPACRTGYACHLGMCVSACNPACATSEICTASGECVAAVDGGSDVGIDSPGADASDAGSDAPPGVDVGADTPPRVDTMVDTSPGVDVGIDASPGPDAPNADTVSSLDSSACPSTLVRCADSCVDPSSNGTYCGASGACTGASAGHSCGGSYCSGGECVYGGCSDILRRGASTGDGLYLVDPDGAGSAAPTHVYCDMTTAGGGWTLVYKIRNDIPDIACPWWSMIAVGSGAAFPTTVTPLAGSAEFEGPTLAIRSAYQLGTGVGGTTEFRATMLRGTATLFDERFQGGVGALTYVASGIAVFPSSGCYDGSIVISSSAGLAIHAGDTPRECTFGDATSCGGTGASVQIPGPTTIYQRTFGSAGFMGTFSDTTTMVWIRDFRGPRP